MNSTQYATLRLVIYVVTGLGTLVAGYLFTKGYIGEPEVALWSGVVALVTGLAAVNTTTGGDHKASE